MFLSLTIGSECVLCIDAIQIGGSSAVHGSINVSIRQCRNIEPSVGLFLYM